MKITIKTILFALVAFLITLTSCTRIDAGHEGIKVNLFGDKKGVDKVSLVTGWVVFNPLTEKVYEYPTFVQTVDYPAFTVNAKGGLAFSMDPTVSIKIIDGQTPEIFKKYRLNLDDIVNTTLYTVVVNACRIQVNKFTPDEITSNRDSVETAIENQLRAELEKESFYLERLTTGLTYPSSIQEAIAAKDKATQDALRVQRELEIVEAEAQKKIVAAEAEKKANELRTKALTPAILQQQWIEKWDGTLPQVVTSDQAGLMLNLSK